MAKRNAVSLSIKTIKAPAYPDPIIGLQVSVEDFWQSVCVVLPSSKDEQVRAVADGLMRLGMYMLYKLKTGV